MHESGSVHEGVFGDLQVARSRPQGIEALSWRHVAATPTQNVETDWYNAPPPPPLDPSDLLFDATDEALEQQVINEMMNDEHEHEHHEA